MRESFSSFVVHHQGGDDRNRAAVIDAGHTGRPLLHLDIGEAAVTVSTARRPEQYTGDDIAFAREFADAAGDYADRVEFMAGAAAGEAFWASIDTCPGCDGGHR